MRHETFGSFGCKDNVIAVNRKLADLRNTVRIALLASVPVFFGLTGGMGGRSGS